MENRNKNLYTFEGGVPPRMIKSDGTYAYPTQIFIPARFIVTDVFVGVSQPCEKAKISVGLKDDQCLFLKDIDVSTIGPRVGDPVYDKDGNILSLGYGKGLVHKKVKLEPIMRKAKKEGDPDVKTGDREIIEWFTRKNYLTTEMQQVYVKIPKECSMEFILKGFRAMVYVVGIQT